MIKSEIRTRLLSLRKNMGSDAVQKNSRMIIERIIELPQYQDAKFVLCYLDIKNEVETTRLIEHAWRKGKKVAVPRVHDREMEFYMIESFEDVEKGNFGIREPLEHCKKAEWTAKSSILIMPGVAFDPSGTRIGYGGGYYDKYFHNVPDLFKVAPAHAMQIVSKIEAESHDLGVDIIVTEGAVYSHE